MEFGPDGRLYVANYSGTGASSGVVKALTIQRNGPGSYVVAGVEELTGASLIPNHNDDGTSAPSLNGRRQVTGLTVGGTATNPVLYVTSSDIRKGGGDGTGQKDFGLDTNSGVITRMTKTGPGTWDVVDIVRGLPRSEENHATNGLDLATINGTDYLIVASGGFTNGGAPSENFAKITEYALAAAVLSVDLTALAQLPVLNDNGRSYIYDLPTLDDPTRPNANGIDDPDTVGYNGIDLNDPWGGNDGLNQAKLVPGGPVQIFSPGYRNAYDLVITQSGALYVTDNGANAGWGGFPVNEGTGNANNDFDPSEPGSQSSSGSELIDNKDHLELVTLDIQNYAPGSFYGGHPTPVRANPSGAGLYTDNSSVLGTTGSPIWRTQPYDPDGSTPGSTTDPNVGLPADWPPVPLSAANAVEGDWRGPSVPNPDGPDDAPIVIWGTNTNGITEYTASNFGNAMKGNLLASASGGVVRRVQLNANGTSQQLTQNFFSGIGGFTLGITANGDDQVFPGTVWAGTLNGIIAVFEPQDFIECIQPGEPGYDPMADYDFDGYTNQDEIDNGTDICSGGSQPDDFDKILGGSPLTSDLNDPDDDGDGIPDALDPMQLGNPQAVGSQAFSLPIYNDLFNFQQGLGGIFGLGLTGLMNNGDTGTNWLNWLDRRDDPNEPNPNDVLGGAPGLMTSHMTSGTALGTANTQEKGYQYGVQVSTATGPFTVTGAMNGFTGPLRLYGNTAAVGGELGFQIGDGTQSNYIKFVVTTDGFLALQEIDDVPQAPLTFNLPVGNRPSGNIVFHFVVNPSNGEVSLEYEIDGGARATLGSITAQGSILTAIQQPGTDLMVGFIGTSNTPGVELEGTWDLLNVVPENSEDFVLRINAGGPALTFNGASFGADQYFSGGQAFSNTSAQVPDLFKTERTSNTKSLSYNIPVPSGGYYVTLHFAEIFWGAPGEGSAGGVGSRIFDVSMENGLVLDDYDIFSEVGTQTVTAKVFPVTVTDGQLNISFSSLAVDGGMDQPKVSAIEVVEDTGQGIPITVSPIAAQTSLVGEQLNGSLSVIASGGDGNLSYNAIGLPPGLFIEPTNGQIGGTVSASAQIGTPYNVAVTVDDSDGEGTDAVMVSFTWTIYDGGLWIDKNENENYTARHESSFVQSGNKFYLMGGRENARTVEVYDYTSDTWTALVDSAPFEFNHFQATEHKGLIWVIGAFQTNAFPTEQPAEHIWSFDPSNNEWVQGPEIPANRRRGSAGLAVYNDKFYIVAGNTIGHDGGFVDWFDEYDPATGTWRALANAPRARDHFHAAVIGNKLYVAGGRLSGGTGGYFNPVIPQVDVYDFPSSTWSTLPAGQNIPTPRGAAMSVNYNGKLVVIGGEVQNQPVYGANTDDALKITEQYDPLTQSWSRLADMNHERHGTQGIVSGNGIFTLAGSPRRGGGNQKNMEVFGADAPVGTALSSGTLSAPASVLIASGGSQELSLQVSGGNVGKLVRYIEITGPDSADFGIVSGDLSNALLDPNSSHGVTVGLNGGTGSKSAILTVHYGASSTLNVLLSNTPGAGLTVANPGTQNNNELDEVSLQINAAGGTGLTYSATGLPPTLSIDPNTGLISGTVSDGGSGNGAFLEQNGLVVVEAESGNTSGWGTTTTGGATGIIANSNHFGSPTGSTIPYQITIGTPGVYRFNWRSFFSGPAPTDENDNWLRFPNNDDVWFFGFQGSPANEAAMISNLQGAQTNIVFPGGTARQTAATTPNGVSSDGYFKIFRSGGTSETYTWQSLTSDSDGHNIYVWFVNPGTYTMEISERSSGHAIDRFALYKVDTYGALYNANLLTGAPESPIGGVGAGAADGSPYNVTVTVTGSGSPPPTESVQFIWNIGQADGNQAPVALAQASPGTGTSPLTVNFTGSGSTDDVGVTGYSWDFGDGGPAVATADPVHTYTAPGSYTAVLTVTDGGGLQSTDSVEITVGTAPSGNIVLTLVDADLDVDLLTLANGLQVSSSMTQGKGLNVRAGTNPAVVGSVHLTLDGPVTVSRTENGAPYALFGDVGGNYVPVALPLGTYTLSAVAYSGANRGGTVLESSSLTFSIVAAGATNQAPVALAQASPGTGTSPLTVNFTGSGSTDDVGVTGYSWDFGDGGPAVATADPVHTYTAPGSYTAVLTVTDGGGLQSTDSVEITVGTAPSGNIVLTLVDADLDVDLLTLANGLQVSSSMTQGKGLNVRAGTNPAVVGSVHLTLDGPVTVSRTENGAPYALFGDVGGNYVPVALPLGTYTLSAVAYSGANRGGTVLESSSLTFSIVAINKSKELLSEVNMDDLYLDKTHVTEINQKKYSLNRGSIYPNPATLEAFIIVDSEQVVKEINLFDINSRLIKSYKPDLILENEGLYRIELEGLEYGLYNVLLINEINQNVVFKLMVRN